jgi:hypothetical protein
VSSASPRIWSSPGAPTTFRVLDRQISLIAEVFITNLFIFKYFHYMGFFYYWHSWYSLLALVRTAWNLAFLIWAKCFLKLKSQPTYERFLTQTCRKSGKILIDVFSVKNCEPAQTQSNFRVHVMDFWFAPKRSALSGASSDTGINCLLYRPSEIGDLF